MGYSPLRNLTSRPDFQSFDESVYWIGHDGNGFCFDNELPRHREFLDRFAISNRLVTCGEYAEFIEDGGYRRPELWLSLGWQTAFEQQWDSPLYWFRQDGQWHHFTLAGPRVVDPESPDCHVSTLKRTHLPVGRAIDFQPKPNGSGFRRCLNHRQFCGHALGPSRGTPSIVESG